MNITGKWIKVLLRLMFCKNGVTNGYNPLYCKLSICRHNSSIDLRIAENQGFIWEIPAMKYSLTTILFLSAAFAHSQVRGKLETNKGEPVASVNVIVHRVADSSRVTGGSTDDQGLFEITGLSSGSYFCRFSSVA